MDADLNRLEEKISQLVSLCATLREENAQLRENLTQAQQNSDTLKSNMLLASQKLEILLETMPADAADSAVVTTEISTDEQIS